MTRLSIPQCAVGVGLKTQHYKAAIEIAHAIDFFEVHAENFMSEGGPPHRWLGRFRDRFPLSIHGVNLSIGGRDAIDRDHLERLACLVERYDPALVSEHLAWSSDGAFFYNDLLPPPLTARSLARVCAHIDEVQTRLGREILIENPSRYLDFHENDIPEPEFLNEVVHRTGCKLLLDINNVYVSAINLGFDAGVYLGAINAASVAEIHLAGHAIDRLENVEIRVDNHGNRICDAVMAHYDQFVARAGPKPTLVEWDTNIPSFSTLAGEAAAAKAVMRRHGSGADVHDAA